MENIFDRNFYPTPPEVIETMLASENIYGKVILEPSAGKGDIVDYLIANGAAEVIACETNENMAKILATKCRIITPDFLKLEAHQISHIHAIIMNPPFTADEKHIIHAWNIAPAGCRIVALCNYETVNNNTYRSRKELNTIIEQNGQYLDLGECFTTAERKTNVQIALVTLTKPGGGYEAEFEGFFLEEDPAEKQENALMPYNLIRDIVNRYIGAIKIYDEQLNSAVNLNNLLSSFYGKDLAFQCTNDNKPVLRNTFKKELQKHAWSWVFGEMNIRKHTTQGLLADINKFVEQNQKIPFTMRNIYRMLEIVAGTTSQRMDKALLEVFGKVTQHYDENRHNLEGWKTNSHYLLNRKFIMPNVVVVGYSGQVSENYHGWAEPINDFTKALCFLTGKDYDTCHSFHSFLSDKRREFGQLYTWGFFEFRAYKKGTVHFTFQNEDIWAKFNQRIAKLLGYPLPESMKPKPTANSQQPAAKSPIVTETKPVVFKPIPIPVPVIETQEIDEPELEEVFNDPNQLSMF